MREISRVNLYNASIAYISDHEDNHIIETVLHGLERDRLIQLLRLNIEFLSEIEEQFLVEDENYNAGNNRIYYDTEYVIDLINKRANMLSEYLSINQMEKFIKEINSLKSKESVFNRLLNELNNISNRELGGISSVGYSNVCNTSRTKVFLSYAYVDRLYTICLYFYMLRNGIDLYVDWIFSDKLDDGILIKRNLTRELQLSEQFLFLRTTNSELHLSGNIEVKGWCAWELGSFYQIDPKEKYYIELYDKSGKVSSELDDLMKFGGISEKHLISKKQYER